MTKIKLCGLQSAQDARIVNSVKPDMAGVILSDGFKRSITIEKAQEIRATLLSEILLVGVFVDENEDYICRYAKSGLLGMIQLHGHENNEFIYRLQQQINLPIIKAFKIREPADVQAANVSNADLVLLDSGTGTGKTFDWKLLSEIRRDFILAGGLHPENVSGAIKQLSPWAVDVSSGIETDGRKDSAKAISFVTNVRACG